MNDKVQISAPAQKCPNCGHRISDTAIGRIKMKVCSKCRSAPIEDFIPCDMAGRVSNQDNEV